VPSESFYDEASGLIGVYDGPCHVTLYTTDGDVVDQVVIPCEPPPPGGAL
jgi:hypothetical protein